MKFFQITVSPNHNFATLSDSNYIEPLPHPFSDYEARCLHDFVKQNIVEVWFRGRWIDNPEFKRYPDSQKIWVENTDYFLSIKTENYIDPAAISDRVAQLLAIEAEVDEFITKLCTPRF